MRKPAVAGLLSGVLLLAGFAASASAAPPDMVSGLAIRPCGERCPPPGHADTAILCWDHPVSDPAINAYGIEVTPEPDLWNGYLSRGVVEGNAHLCDGADAATILFGIAEGAQVTFRVRAQNGDGFGPWSTSRTFEVVYVGDGFTRSVDGDSPAEAIAVIRDYGLEWAPVIRIVLGAVFVVGLTFWLVRQGLARSRSEMRL